MLWNEVITLVKLTNSRDSVYGGVEQASTQRTVFANRLSVGRTEFYMAMQTGFRPEVIFEIRAVDYDYDAQVIHNGRTYDIIRAYSKNNEVLELVCKGAA
jgi:SPP1 family predicted phage head-tail adaptor